MSDVSRRTASTNAQPVVIKIPGVAHLAVGFFAIGLLALVFAVGFFAIGLLALVF
ncbi:PH domain-containing protein, partial [Mycobacterium sp. CBMA361]|nr:PH domain-containing protein [Mycolicibacterium sp. CBMA 361]